MTKSDSRYKRKYKRLFPLKVQRLVFVFQGEQGVFEVLQKLKDELRIAMALAGEQILHNKLSYKDKKEPLINRKPCRL